MSIEAKARLLFSLQSSTDRCVSVFIQTINNEAKEKLGIHTKAIQLLKDASEGYAVPHSQMARRERKLVKKNIKALMVEASNHKWEAHLETLQVQNAVAGVFSLEEENRRWRRLLSSMPSGQLSFVLKAITGTLPTPMYLRRMSSRVDAKCMLCDSPYYCTAKHFLNSCSEALNRYKWRHDQVLLIIASFLKRHLKVNCSIYADLENWRATENPPGTIPPSALATRSAPDIVIVDQSKPHQKVFVMIELTVPWNSADSIASAHRRKAKKENYCQLVANLKGLGADAKLLPIEVGSWATLTEMQERCLGNGLLFQCSKQHLCWTMHLQKPSAVAKPSSSLDTRVSGHAPFDLYYYPCSVVP